MRAFLSLFFVSFLHSFQLRTRSGRLPSHLPMLFDFIAPTPPLSLNHGSMVVSVVLEAKEDNVGKLTIDGEGSRIFFKARQEEQGGDFAEAQKLYQEVITIEPNFIYAWSNLGNVLTAQGDLNDALLCYKKAISLKPPLNTLSVMLLNKASVELSLDQSELAIRDFDIAAKIVTPENKNTIITNKAVALSNIGDWSAACSLFDSVISSAERNALPWWLRYSMALLETGRGTEAVAYIQRSLNRFPGESECLAFSTALYSSLGSPQASKEYWEKLSVNDQQMYSSSDFLSKKLHWGPKSLGGMKEFLSRQAR